MKEIEIKNGNSRAVVSSIGGTVVLFECEGKNIIYPEKTLKKGAETKKRRGIPICFPFFGSPKAGFKRLRRHGWLRNQKLRVVSTSSNSVILEGENRYRKSYPWQMKYQVTVSIVKDGLLKIKLWVIRLKDGIASGAPVNPAIHPYFANSFGNKKARIVKINDSNSPFNAEIKVHPDGKAQIFPATDDIFINLGQKRVRMSLKGDFGKECLALWSDDKRYFCVEPVLADPKNFNTPNGRYLEEGEWLTIICLLKVLN